MVVLGIILLVVGFVTGLSILWTSASCSWPSAGFCGSVPRWGTPSRDGATTGSGISLSATVTAEPAEDPLHAVRAA